MLYFLNLSPIKSVSIIYYWVVYFRRISINAHAAESKFLGRVCRPFRPYKIWGISLLTWAKDIRFTQKESDTYDYSILFYIEVLGEDDLFIYCFDSNYMKF